MFSIELEAVRSKGRPVAAVAAAAAAAVAASKSEFWPWPSKHTAVLVSVQYYASTAH